MQGRLYRNNVNINLNQVTNKIAYSTVEYVILVLYTCIIKINK